LDFSGVNDPKWLISVNLLFELSINNCRLSLYLNQKSLGRDINVQAFLICSLWHWDIDLELF
jgi:hypothetical protein